MWDSNLWIVAKERELAGVEIETDLPGIFPVGKRYCRGLPFPTKGESEAKKKTNKQRTTNSLPAARKDMLMKLRPYSSAPASDVLKMNVCCT
jgi:hypothetical protein